MNFTDVIKKSVLEKFQSSDLTTTAIVITLAMALALGLFIYWVYRNNTRSGFYNKGFNKSIASLPVITAAIMLAMGSNITISLGMVGALSIVRFRNAIKDPADLTYLFWSISIGIIVGAGLFELAIIMSIVIAILVYGLDLIPSFRTPSLLVINGENVNIEEEIITISNNYAKYVKVRSRNINKKGVEWVIEMFVSDETNLMKLLSEVDGITTLHLMTHDGDIRF